MRFLLLGYGKTIQAVANYFDKIKIKYQIATEKKESKDNFLSLDEQLLELDSDYYILKSPGIPVTQPLIQKLKTKFTFINELDLFYLLQIPVKVIAVTGSNGKTTCLAMLKHLFHNANKKVIVCGNSHEPIFSYAEEFPLLDYLLVELSSFQLEDMHFYAPLIATILNLSPNHLDATFSVEKYYQAKYHIYRQQNLNHYFLANVEYSFPNVPAKIIPIQCQSYQHLPYPIQSCVCQQVANICQIPQEIYENSIHTFQPLRFRNTIHKIKNYVLINDAKSTSVAATNFALKRISESAHILLIIGGKDKKIDYQNLNLERVDKLYVYGEIKKYFSPSPNVTLFSNLKECFFSAIQEKKIDTILFSPATSSFDQYANYQQRGEEFASYLQMYERM